MHENELSNVIIGAAIEVHRTLGGPGLLEEVYEEALCEELRLQGFKCLRQVPYPLVYKGRQLEKRLIVDILVNDLVIIECKATDRHHPIHEAQLLTYLRITDKRLGLLINLANDMSRTASTASSTASKTDRPASQPILTATTMLHTIPHPPRLPASAPLR